MWLFIVNSIVQIEQEPLLSHFSPQIHCGIPVDTLVVITELLGLLLATNCEHCVPP